MDGPIPSSALERPLDSSLGPMLDHLALFAVRGADARGFLDSQLTRNVPELVAGQPISTASIAGDCSTKGRRPATFVLWYELSYDPSYQLP